MGKKPAIAWVGTFWFGLALAGGGCESTSAPKRTYNPPPMLGRNSTPAPTTVTGPPSVVNPALNAGAGPTVAAPDVGAASSRNVTPSTVGPAPALSPLNGPASVNGFQTQPKTTLTPPSAPPEEPPSQRAIPTTDMRTPPPQIQGSRYGSDPKPPPPEIPASQPNPLPAAAAAATPPPRSPVSFDDGVGGMPPTTAPEVPGRAKGFDPSPNLGSPPPTSLVLPVPPASQAESGVRTFAPPPSAPLPTSTRGTALPPVSGPDASPFSK